MTLYRVTISEHVHAVYLVESDDIETTLDDWEWIEDAERKDERQMSAEVIGWEEITEPEYRVCTCGHPDCGAC